MNKLMAFLIVVFLANGVSAANSWSYVNPDGTGGSAGGVGGLTDLNNLVSIPQSLSTSVTLGLIGNGNDGFGATGLTLDPYGAAIEANEYAGITDGSQYRPTVAVIGYYLYYAIKVEGGDWWLIKHNIQNDQWTYVDLTSGSTTLKFTTLEGVYNYDDGILLWGTANFEGEELRQAVKYTANLAESTCVTCGATGSKTAVILKEQHPEYVDIENENPCGDFSPYCIISQSFRYQLNNMSGMHYEHDSEGVDFTGGIVKPYGIFIDDQGSIYVGGSNEYVRWNHEMWWKIKNNFIQNVQIGAFYRSGATPIPADGTTPLVYNDNRYVVYGNPDTGRRRRLRLDLDFFSADPSRLIGGGNNHNNGIVDMQRTAPALVTSSGFYNVTDNQESIQGLADHYIDYVASSGDNIYGYGPGSTFNTFTLNSSKHFVVDIGDINNSDIYPCYLTLNVAGAGNSVVATTSCAGPSGSLRAWNNVLQDSNRESPIWSIAPPTGAIAYTLTGDSVEEWSGVLVVSTSLAGNMVILSDPFQFWVQT